MSEQPLLLYDFRTPEELFELMDCWRKKGIVMGDFVIKLTVLIERLQEQLESAQDVIYEYIKIYGVERECSKYLEKYAERTK